MSTIYRNAIIGQAMKLRAAQKDCCPEHAADQALRRYLGLGPADGIAAGSQTARQLGYSAPAAHVDLLPQIVQDIASELARPPSPFCPNCGHPVASHQSDGCLLNTLIEVVMERGRHTPDQMQALHAEVHAGKFWDAIGPVIDRLGRGEFKA